MSRPHSPACSPSAASPRAAVATTATKRGAKRIPFGRLVEEGRISPGTLLTDRLRRVSATVAADGTLVAGRLRGSIHQVGAQLQNTPSCNGWTFWHLEREGELVAIDVLREVLEAE